MSSFCQHLVPGCNYINKKKLQRRSLEHPNDQAACPGRFCRMASELCHTEGSAAFGDEGGKGNEKGEKPRPAQRSRGGGWGVGGGESEGGK